MGNKGSKNKKVRGKGEFPSIRVIILGDKGVGDFLSVHTFTISIFNCQNMY